MDDYALSADCRHFHGTQLCLCHMVLECIVASLDKELAFLSREEDIHEAQGLFLGFLIE